MPKRIEIIQLTKTRANGNQFALFDLAFRPFFIGATSFGALSILIWYAVYSTLIQLNLSGMSTFQWHSHEMLFGYCMAVIAGFLLTAISNWTGIQTINKKPLVILFLLWLVARIAFALGRDALPIAASSDILFMLYLLLAIMLPITRSRQWSNLIITSKVVILILCNCTFYLGAFGFLENGIAWGIYGALFSIISMILMIGNRVIPNFIVNGLEEQVNIKNPKWISVSSLLVFLVFSINQIFIFNQTILFLSASILFIINAYRLYCWYVPGIWKKPLLWSLYLSIAFITLGFLLSALTVIFEISPFQALHAFAYGGIGLATFGMMVRVTLGHTGRSIKTPPNLTLYMLLILTVGSIIRVILPLFNQTNYRLWIVLAQMCWITSSVLFLITFFKMLIFQSVDGKRV